MDRDQEPERYYDWMLWKLRQENPNWYSSEPKYEGERLVTKDNPNHHKIIKERFEHETERSIRQNLPLYRNSLTGLGLAQEMTCNKSRISYRSGMWSKSIQRHHSKSCWYGLGKVPYI